MFYTDLGLFVLIVPWEGEAPAEPSLKGSAGASPSQGWEISTLNRYYTAPGGLDLPIQAGMSISM